MQNTFECSTHLRVQFSVTFRRTQMLYSECVIATKAPGIKCPEAPERNMSSSFMLKVPNGDEFNLSGKS